MARKHDIELDHYIQRLKPEDLFTKRLIFKQASEMDMKGRSHCGCGNAINPLNSFRCVYCGLFLCVKCAEEHFGVTREDYDKMP